MINSLLTKFYNKYTIIYVQHSPKKYLNSLTNEALSCTCFSSHFIFLICVHFTSPYAFIIQWQIVNVFMTSPFSTKLKIKYQEKKDTKEKANA